MVDNSLEASLWKATCSENKVQEAACAVYPSGEAGSITPVEPAPCENLSLGNPRVFPNNLSHTQIFIMTGTGNTKLSKTLLYCFLIFQPKEGGRQ
jgi:hypothetical protein